MVPPPGGDEADADFDQADVAFGGRLNAISVHRDFAPATEREASGANDDGHISVPHRLRRPLKRTHHQVDFVPVALLRFEEQQHQVRTG